jgi:hypothetical protein
VSDSERVYACVGPYSNIEHCVIDESTPVR